MLSKPFFLSVFRFLFLPYFLVLTISQIFVFLAGRWLFVPRKGPIWILRKHTILLRCYLFRGKIMIPHIEGSATQMVNYAATTF
jgi:hypothetical protein